MSALYEFLQKNQIKQSEALPLVHSTEAYFLKKILRTGKIDASPCKVFKNEHIAYFFVGRPAYKSQVTAEAAYWELPICFIFEYSMDNIKRIYPFDSGAFATKRYPSFIQMMPLNEFEVGNDKNAVPKLIGTFFGSAMNYYRLKPTPDSAFKRDFQVEILNEEILALHKLIESKSDKYDDRRFSVEAQFSEGFDLKERKLLAIVLPDIYLENREIVKLIEQQFSATILSYAIYPLNVSYYYYAIYERVENFYRERGLFNV
jgi:hypothetical protein